MTWELLKVLYKTYFCSGIIPVTNRAKKQHCANEAFVMIYFRMKCESQGIDPEQALKEIERYTTWTDELIRILPNYTNLY
ncbi:hypothetical protein LCGC14_1638000 [marine sediment metagenome]|uniref:Uncharacterized protein n=1 Tax=marine sediment metagenome TaxID=412755 RepID=A0A0F9I110_9ZZZZ